MANGHVKIHDPFSSLGGTTDLKPTSDSDSMEDTVELRLLMAYAKRRGPQRTSPQKESPSQDVSLPGHLNGNESSSPQRTEKKKKKKRRMKGWRRNIFSCIKPQREDEEQRQKEPNCDYESGSVCEEVPVEEEDELKEAANKLTKIADEIQFLPPEIEPDSPEGEDENVEKMIGLLLRDAGDRLNENELKDAAIATELFRDYSFFKLLMSTLLLRMGLRSPHPDSPGPKASPETQIAVACEVTSRLSQVNSLPRNRLLDHGARYLQHYYSPWVQQQGGYAEAFYSDDDDDE